MTRAEWCGAASGGCGDVLDAASSPAAARKSPERRGKAGDKEGQRLPRTSWKWSDTTLLNSWQAQHSPRDGWWVTSAQPQKPVSYKNSGAPR